MDRHRVPSFSLGKTIFMNSKQNFRNCKWINNFSYQTQFIKEHNHNKENITLCESLETEET